MEDNNNNNNNDTLVYEAPEMQALRHQKLLNELMPLAADLQRTIGFAPFLHLMTFMLCQLQIQLEDKEKFTIDEKYNQLLEYSYANGAAIAMSLIPELESTFKKFKEEGNPITAPLIIFPKNPLHVVEPLDGEKTIIN